MLPARGLKLKILAVQKAIIARRGFPASFEGVIGGTFPKVPPKIPRPRWHDAVKKCPLTAIVPALPKGEARRGKQLLVSVLGGGTKTLSGAGKELSTQMTGTVGHHCTYGGAKNFYFAAQEQVWICLHFPMRAIKTQAVKVFEGVLGGTFSKKSPLKTASFFKSSP